MAVISATIHIDSLLIEDPAAFDVQVTGFIGRDVEGDLNEPASTKFMVEFAENVTIGRNVSLTRGRTVVVSGMFNGCALEFNPVGLSGVILIVTALVIE